MKYTIRYQYGSYSGTSVQFADDAEQAIAKMWSEFRRKGYLTLPMAYTSAKVTQEEAE